MFSPRPGRGLNSVQLPFVTLRSVDRDVRPLAGGLSGDFVNESTVVKKPPILGPCRRFLFPQYSLK